MTRSIERFPATVLDDRASLAKLVATDQPFIVEGALRGELAPPRASIERFVEAYGDHVVRVSSRTFYLPLSTEQCRVHDYVRDVERVPARLHSSDPPIPYVFHDDIGEDAFRQGSGATETPFGIAELCPLPVAFSDDLWRGKRLAAIRIGLGPRFSHAGLHTHGVAINLLAFGSKRWFLYPSRMGERQLKRMFALIRGARVPSPQLFWLEHFHPLAMAGEGDIAPALRDAAEALAARGLFSIPPTETWSEPLHADDLRGIEARQEAGDLVYVPEHWPHAIINEAWSLSVIYELVLAGK